VNNLRARLFAPVLRGLEKILPAPVYCGALYPVAWARALIHRGVSGRTPIAWPAGLGGMQTGRSLALPRLPVYLNRTFELLPDRLAAPKWRGHCRFIGLDPVKRLVDAGRPVILGFAHFGPIGSLRNWLRATGVPVAIFVRGKAHTRNVMKRRKDRWALFPDVALTFYQDQLADAIMHLERGGVLAIALDSDNGRQMRVPFGDGWTCQMATGPFRLARRHGAVLVPCAIYNERPWHVAVEFGAPVGSDLLAAGEAQAGEDLLSKLLPVWLAHPAEWTPQLASRFSRT
jgi:lauroyl/myristoyl acyltransferase